MPRLLIATTVNVYVVPFARPVTTSVVAVELNRTGVWATWPTHGVTTYPVTGYVAAIALIGGCHDTVA